MSQRDVPSDEELQPIRDLCDAEVSYRTDGWRQLIYMEGLRLTANLKVDGLICLNHDNPTYPTKLYLEQNVGGGVNWNEQAYILGRQWHTFSWSNVPNSLPAVEILAAHLAPLRRGIAA